jgi:hypothetical protein
MDFNPRGNEEVALAGRTYRVQAHGGALADKAIRIAGGRADVYRLVATDGGASFALKVMKPAYRVPELIRNRDLLAALAPVPGFDACKLTYFTPIEHGDDLHRFPNLAYASLMPWIRGTTWNEHMANGADLSTEASWALAYDCVVLLRVLERNQIAHCDISGGNVIVHPDQKGHGRQVTVIDFDEVYWPGAPRPRLVPAGTPGYRRRDHQQWEASGDRLAAAILIAEMLGWRDSHVRSHSSGDSYFDDDECGSLDSERYQTLQRFLIELSPRLGTLFEHAWHARTGADCPPLSWWQLALIEAQGLPWIPLDRRDTVKIRLSPALNAQGAGTGNHASGNGAGGKNDRAYPPTSGVSRALIWTLISVAVIVAISGLVVAVALFHG